MSALPPIADMCAATSDVRFVPKADIASFIPSSAEDGYSLIISGLGIGTGSVRQQDGQGRISQDVLGRSAEYPLSQSALRVGTLDKQVAAQ